ncbi:hypothetical protein MTBBW1_80135 [Desulfamplus magnetovallimortis]|uniref:Uncharacterized protein n=1 Tax=Desulfamplus magnetovallimortis TaxID=1246637 RepID=L0R6Z5_9BACT|nr:hypothetical protein DEMABW1_80135 [Desulfamplus magnetovallimortis BW-1]SLM32792.1 hypothetical protein MTBBW1_80135 [Desulfamplus magnetovallimortis]
MSRPRFYFVIVIYRFSGYTKIKLCRGEITGSRGRISDGTGFVTG